VREYLAKTVNPGGRALTDALALADPADRARIFEGVGLLRKFLERIAANEASSR
jgi:hypothetical protein